MNCASELIPHPTIQTILDSILHAFTQAEIDAIVAELEAYMGDADGQAMVVINAAYWTSRQDDDRAQLIFTVMAELEVPPSVAAPALAEYRCGCDGALREMADLFLQMLV